MKWDLSGFAYRDCNTCPIQSANARYNVARYKLRGWEWPKDHELYLFLSVLCWIRVSWYYPKLCFSVMRASLICCCPGLHVLSSFCTTSLADTALQAPLFRRTQMKYILNTSINSLDHSSYCSIQCIINLQCLNFQVFSAHPVVEKNHWC